MNSNISVQDDQAAETVSSGTIADQKRCANCNIQLEGQFCHSCGQSSTSMIKFFGEVIKELLDDALGYDSRFKHSLSPLFFKPGRLTLDYVKGKRFHYVLPFKLYLITSVLLIILIKNVSNPEIQLSNDAEANQTQQKIGEEVREEINQAFNVIEINKGQAFSKNIGVNATGDSKEITIKESTNSVVEIESKPTKKKNKRFTLGGGEKDIELDWDNEAKQLNGIDQIESEFLRDFFNTINPKLKFWIEDPKPLVESIIETLPYMMFIILPIFGLFLKSFYFLSKRYYTEHLVFLLHNHSFIYMLMMVQIGLDFGDDQLVPIEHWLAQSVSGAFRFLSVLLNIWMVVYVFLAMKRFYRQGWRATILKTVTLGLLYFVMLAVGFVVTMAFGAYQA